MRNTQYFNLLFRLCILGLLIACLWLLSSKTIQQAFQGSAQSETQLPVVITPLPTINGVSPVEIQCGFAHLSAPNQLTGFDCKLKNASSKAVTAANVIYSIVLEQNGQVIKNTVSSTIETLVHPDFKGTSNPILPGGEINLGPPGPISYQDAIITGIEIKLDYVEFEDKTTFGPDERGSNIISNMREGAAKYKRWLKQKYNQKGNSVDAVVPLLEQDQPLPSELEFPNPNQEQGARAYRSRLRKFSQTRATAEVEKLLN